MMSATEITRFYEDLAAKFGESDDRTTYFLKCFEACIPKLFWECSSKQISKNNKAVFRDVILKYCKHRKAAQRHGYSLLLHGDNGVGKTLFLSFVLTQMIKRGCSVYYTTLPELDADFKRSFDDKQWDDRLRQALNSDFLAIDEIGKEHYKADSFLRVQFERILKRRYDDGDPCLLATNMDLKSLYGAYGLSMSSIWDGKYLKAALMPGDHRLSSVSDMHRNLGIDNGI